MLAEVLAHVRHSPAVASIAIFAVLCTACCLFVKRKNSRPRLLPHAPFAGLQGGIGSIEEARLRFLTHAAEMLQEGYRMVS